MTYSDWQQELSEGVKTRLIIKALKGVKKLSKKLGRKVKGSVEDIGATKAGQGRNVFIKNPDGTRIQNPNVKPLTPDYQNLGQAARGEGQLRLFNTKNPNYKVTNPTPKPEKITKSSSGPNRSAIRKRNEEAIKTAKGLIKQQNALKQQGKDGLQVNLLKKSDYPKRVQKYLGDDFEKLTKMQESAIAIKGGSKLIPLLMTGIGAAGTIMQARRKGKRKIGSMEKRLYDRQKKNTDQSDDLIKARPGEAQKQNKLIDKYSKKYKTQKQKTDTQKLLRDLAKGEVIQDEFSAPTNSMGGGAIAGSVEAGDNPPVKKKKRYIYGGTGSRKMWMNNK